MLWPLLPCLCPEQAAFEGWRWDRQGACVCDGEVNSSVRAATSRSCLPKRQKVRPSPHWTRPLVQFNDQFRIHSRRRIPNDPCLANFPTDGMPAFLAFPCRRIGKLRAVFGGDWPPLLVREVLPKPSVRGHALSSFIRLVVVTAKNLSWISEGRTAGVLHFARATPTRARAALASLEPVHARTVAFPTPEETRPLPIGRNHRKRGAHFEIIPRAFNHLQNALREQRHAAIHAG